MWHRLSNYYMKYKHIPVHDKYVEVDARITV